MTENAANARREYMREYKRKNAKKINAYNRAWRKANPEKTKQYNANYWMKKAAGQSENQE
jgi:hypothetical protein